MPAMLRELETFARHSRGERGCVEYTYLCSPTDAELMVIIDRWSDRPSLDVHLSSREMAEYRKATAPLVLERSHEVYEASEVKG